VGWLNSPVAINRSEGHLATMPSPPRPGYPTTDSPWLQAFGRAALRVAGWTIVGELPHLPKFVIIVAPHTSNWDFPVGLAAKFALDLDIHWLGKDTLFRGPVGPILRKLGGRPVHRETPEGLVAEVAATVNAEPRFLLALAPEGTRTRVSHWRTGFYHIAEATGMPIVPVWFDWSRKEIGIGQPVHASGNLEAEIAALQSLYRPEMAKNRGGFWRNELPPDTR
jgi:1-acyl-sn-glycerol-3-phosphate acyltransferase